MIKNLIIICFLLTLLINPSVSEKSISIEAKVNDKIITNIDIYKEIEYLKILNPNLNELNKIKIFEISKNSLINQLIKQSEVEKYFDLNKNIKLLDQVYFDLIQKLNLNNEKELEQLLTLKNSFSIDEIKTN